MLRYHSTESWRCRELERSDLLLSWARLFYTCWQNIGNALHYALQHTLQQNSNTMSCRLRHAQLFRISFAKRVFAIASNAQKISSFPFGRILYCEHPSYRVQRLPHLRSQIPKSRVWTCRFSCVYISWASNTTLQMHPRNPWLHIAWLSSVWSPKVGFSRTPKTKQQ